MVIEGEDVVCQSLKAVASPAHLTEPHALQSCWDLQLSGVGADALRVALECDLFAHLGQFVSADKIAEELVLDHANTGYLLEILWSMNLLECEGGAQRCYRNLPVAAHYLSTDSDHYCGDALLFRHHILRQFGMQLEGLVRKGSGMTSGPDADTIQQGWAMAARSQIEQEQRAVTAEVACKLFTELPEFPHAKRLLDLGGGPGLVAIALAQSQPALTGTVFEYDAVAATAAERIAEAGLSHRLQAVGGDLNKDDFGADYDLIWCSSVLHFVQDIPAVLDRLYQAMRPGGVLVCCHAEVHATAPQARRILQYYLSLRMQGRHVLPEGELAHSLSRAGFVDVKQWDDVRFPVTPVTALVAHKARGESR
ncbi:MAG: methyltransferase domain-containing protein [Lautropia sp.]|nr:methyltransferase domain-containing protein [Lautropia sp.]